ncbi:probable E3 ubiquitin-protein ligase HIP1 isoform X2 [Oryza brachyantha]|uniref:probable E3 ubiquitin-protein ligase HIP1 isoform X2 n=1 Tax=Oryza brachyantha TaxID=4533 RepID=UPI0007762AEE|nr:probable E3 ubiquitin-protein ligase HIP1 isoform X2 [Oryza brachyantha]
MQGQKNSVEQLADVFGFDHASSSGNPVMDQQGYWNNILGSVESHNLQGYQVNRSDGAIPYGNSAHQDGTFLGFWESGEASASGSSLHFGSSNEIKTEQRNIGGVLRIGERRLAAEHNLSLDNVDIGLNINGNDLSGQSSNVNGAAQGSEQHGGCSRTGTNAQASDLRLHPYRTFILGAEQPESFNSLNGSENSIGDFSLMPEGIDHRPGSSLDGRRLACKRKNIEGVHGHGQCSAGASTSFSHRNDSIFHSIASSSRNPSPSTNLPSPNCLLVPSAVDEQPPTYVATAGLSSSSYDLSGGNNNSGMSQRSFRPRTTLAQQIGPYGVWPSSSAIRHSNSWNHQPPPFQSTFDEPPEVIPVVSSLNFQYQHPMNVVPGIPQMAHRFSGQGTSSSRTGNLENRTIGSEDFSGRNVVATNFPDAVPPSTLDMRHLIPEPSSWNVDGRVTTIPGNVPSSRATASLMVNPPASPFIAHQNLHRRNPRNLSEEISRLSGALRSHQHPRLRSGFLLERQGDGVWGVPLSTRSREGRRLIEIRNALEMIHRGENVRFESIFYGGVDIHDRHRDMRLDIDNMSYEELLALEERIGNVSTGLSEEEVTKLLKQREFSSWRLEASVEDEPCCICQEEYVDHTQAVLVFLNQ